ncbi:hypothetical protein BHM03_00002980 [Ensete ventricosum]|nr:hypothetical protein BHM03_00002980 [Ensete ventricosum]
MPSSASSSLCRNRLYRSRALLNLFRRPCRLYHRCPSLVVASSSMISSPLHPPLLPPHSRTTATTGIVVALFFLYHRRYFLLPSRIASTRPSSTSSIAQQDPIQIPSSAILQQHNNL